MENKIRNNLNEIYFGKTRDIVNGLRSVVPLSESKQTQEFKVRKKYDLEIELRSYVQDQLKNAISQKNAGQN